MAYELHEECGIAAIFNHTEAAKMVYLMLYALQHRGPESCGISTPLAQYKNLGQVADVFNEPVLKQLTGTCAIGHVRYRTAGDSSALNAQPITVKCWKGTVSVGHNGNITNAQELREELEKEGAIFQTNSDTEVILHLIARAKSDDFLGCLIEALSQIQGAYSLVILYNDELYAVRDPQGFRPLSIGVLNENQYVVASETCAFDLIDAQYVQELQPGSIAKINGSGLQIVEFAQPKPAHCIFEHVYFSRPDSVVFGRPVALTRVRMGEILAKEAPIDADIVIGVPDSGIEAGAGYAKMANLPSPRGLVRNHYVGRTFIEPSQKIREFGVKLKLSPVRHVVAGKRIVLVDDSIVRGTTTKKIVRLLRGAGAKEIHVRISCPPTISPCFYGVDTPTTKELIAANMSIQEICRHIEADSLAYLSLEGLRTATSSNGDFCNACYTGEYPTLIQIK